MSKNKLLQNISLATLVGSLYTGCKTTEMYEKNQQTVSEDVSGAVDGREYLREDEYVLPDAVVGALWSSIVNGAYQTKTLLPIEEQKEARARRNLEQLGISPKEIKTYLELYRRPKIIIYNQRIFNDYRFKFVIPHERGHKFIDLSLTEQEKGVLNSAHQDIVQKVYNIRNTLDIKNALQDGISLSEIQVLNKQIMQICSQNKEWGVCNPLNDVPIDLLGTKTDDCGIYASYDRDFKKQPLLEEEYLCNLRQYSKHDYDEFFSTLTTGAYPHRVELALQRDHSQAYKIFQRMKEAVKLE